MEKEYKCLTCKDLKICYKCDNPIHKEINLEAGKENSWEHDDCSCHGDYGFPCEDCQ